MKIYITLLLIIIVSITSTVPAGYQLVWSDEFDKNYIDTSKWEFDVGGDGWGNNELQFYTSRGENAFIENNQLHIRARRENYDGRDYTSARLKTKGKFEFKYGYVEAKIALPRLLSGIRPSFQMLGSNIDSEGWPKCGEIDIFETLNEENIAYATCKWNSNGYAQYGLRSGWIDLTQFHTYSLYWDEEFMRVSVDDKQIFEILIKNGEGNTWAYHNKFFIVLLLNIGGNYQGWNINNNKLPADMIVDYVRVYQNNPTTPTNQNPSSQGSADIKSAVPKDYKLVWSDEFDKGSIDTSKWDFDIGGNGWDNNELQFYTSRGENAFIENNQLHIRAIKGKYEGKDYTSARLKTKGKFEFKYGFVEARIAAPRLSGIRPVFRMMGSTLNSEGWPKCGEIDIFEAINEENVAHASCRWEYNGLAEYGLASGYLDVTQFHTYGLFWNEEYVRVFVDKDQIYEMDIRGVPTFKKDFFIILNLALGGNWQGFNIDNNKLPADMIVDYVRVYKLDQTSPYYNSNVPDGYKLVWSDEFDKNYIDTSKWVFDVGGHGWGNNELQFYTSRSENAFIENNQLHIRARRENYGGREYTSARLKTQGKFEFKFGYVEARIALPTFLGACPAFWMLGSSIDAIGWPRCGEIDMLETINEENLVYNTVHWDYNGYTKYGLRTDYIDVTQFHIYSVLWDEEMIRIYVDNRQTFEMSIKDGASYNWAFHNNFYIILNIAMGGNWQGWNIDVNKLPADMVIDYIRVFQK